MNFVVLQVGCSLENSWKRFLSRNKSKNLSDSLLDMFTVQVASWVRSLMVLFSLNPLAILNVALLYSSTDSEIRRSMLCTEHVCRAIYGGCRVVPT